MKKAWWERFWDHLSLRMKIITVAILVGTFVMLTHGTYTYRKSHQKAFALGVTQSIRIETIQARNERGVLILQGHGTREQKEYAEKIAQWFLERYADAINAPKTIKNEIAVRPSSAYQRFAKARPQQAPTQRAPQSVSMKARTNLQLASKRAQN